MSREESIIELQNFDDIQSITSEESEAANCDAASRQAEKPPDKEETSLSVVIESKKDCHNIIKKSGSECEKQTHSGIVLSPLQLGQ